MEQTGRCALHIEVSAEGASADDIDQMGHEFLSELRDTKVESVSLAPAAAVPQQLLAQMNRGWKR